MPYTGEVTVTPTGKKWDVEWKMNFATFLEEDHGDYCSPLFFFEGETWYLAIWPNGNKFKKSTEYIHLRLRKWSFNGPPISLELSFSVKTDSDKNDFKRQITKVFKVNSVHVVDRFLSKSDFDKRQFEFFSTGFLTVICTLKKLNFTESASAECSHCNETFDSNEISSHEKQCRIKCPECLAVIPLKNLCDHECLIPTTEAAEKLFDDLK